MTMFALQRYGYRKVDEKITCIVNNIICLACNPQLSLIQQQDYIECECDRLGEFAVTNDVERGYGWTIPAGAVAGLVIVSVHQDSRRLSSIRVLCLHFRLC